jgi:hypothetical protein
MSAGWHPPIDGAEIMRTAKAALGAALEKALTNPIEQRRKQPATPCGGVEIPLSA